VIGGLIAGLAEGALFINPSVCTELMDSAYLENSVLAAWCSLNSLTSMSISSHLFFWIKSSLLFSSCATWQNVGNQVCEKSTDSCGPLSFFFKSEQKKKIFVQKKERRRSSPSRPSPYQVKSLLRRPTNKSNLARGGEKLALPPASLASRPPTPPSRAARNE